MLFNTILNPFDKTTSFSFAGFRKNSSVLTDYRYNLQIKTVFKQ